jgi:hypothetical protein
MPKHPEYKIVSDYKQIKRGGGRKKAVNNDYLLIARALYGLETGKYKNYGDAATKLARSSRLLVDRTLIKTGGIETIIDRLRRRISDAQKDSDPTTAINVRLQILRQR